MESKSSNFRAVLDLGSGAFRLLIVEVLEDGSWHELESLEQPVDIGRDVFKKGKISSSSITKSLKVLSMYTESLKAWEIKPSQVSTVATSAIREAINRDSFLDIISLRTGFIVNVLIGMEAGNLTFAAVYNCLRGKARFLKQRNTMMLELGNGNAELTLLRRAKVVGSHSFPQGIIRLKEKMQAGGLESEENLSRVIRDSLQQTFQLLNLEMATSSVRSLVLMGSDARLVARLIGEKSEHDYWMIDAQVFREFLDKMRKMSVDDVIDEFDMSYQTALEFLPACWFYSYFLDLSPKAENVIVPNTNIRHGVLFKEITLAEKHFPTYFRSHVLSSTKSLAKKYSYDAKHAAFFSKSCLSIFNAVQKAYSLPSHWAIYLEVAAELHDIGKFISHSAHHKHSQYIIAQSELFGFSTDELYLVSLIARFHRKRIPTRSHVSLVNLSRKDRLMVMKLSSILRLVEALDASHDQSFQLTRVEVKGKDLVLETKSEDITAQEVALSFNSGPFTEIYGLKLKVSQIL